MKSKPLIVIKNQRGSVINVALLILILIFLVGIGLHKISTTDINIASNMKTQATTFYEAEAGLELAGEMIDQNLECKDDVFTTDDEIIGGNFFIKNAEFGYNARSDAFIPSGDGSDADFYFPPDLTTIPLTIVKVGGTPRLVRGGAIQMAAGYEGLGKGTLQGSGSILFDVYVRQMGTNNSSAIHFMQWSYEADNPGNSCNF